MRMAQSQNMKLRRFRSRREFKKYLILAPPGQIYQLVFRIARTGQKQFYYLAENTVCSQQSILLRSTSCTFCTLYDRILFRLNKKKRATLYTDWRPVTICKLLWEGSPNTRSSLRKYSIVRVS